MTTAPSELERVLAALDANASLTMIFDERGRVSLADAARLLREMAVDLERVAGAYVTVEPEDLCRDAANAVRQKWRLK
jgi:hypothetical protein